jgi:hypothetical protein
MPQGWKVHPRMCTPRRYRSNTNKLTRRSSKNPAAPARALRPAGAGHETQLWFHVPPCFFLHGTRVPPLLTRAGLLVQTMILDTTRPEVIQGPLRKRMIRRRSRFEGRPAGAGVKWSPALRSSANRLRASRLASVSR